MLSTHRGGDARHKPIEPTTRTALSEAASLPRTNSRSRCSLARYSANSATLRWPVVYRLCGVAWKAPNKSDRAVQIGGLEIPAPSCASFARCSTRDDLDEAVVDANRQIKSPHLDRIQKNWMGEPSLGGCLAGGHRHLLVA